MEHFVITVNGWKSLTVMTKSSILDVAAVLDPAVLVILLLNFMLLYGSYRNSYGLYRKHVDFFELL